MKAIGAIQDKIIMSMKSEIQFESLHYYYFRAINKYIINSCTAYRLIKHIIIIYMPIASSPDLRARGRENEGLVHTEFSRKSSVQ